MNSQLLITPFQKGYEADIQQVFYSSVHDICRQDYTQQQIEIWTEKIANLALWTEQIQRLKPYIAFKDNCVCGYADIQAT